jgi:hypothetical protein
MTVVPLFFSMVFPMSSSAASDEIIYGDAGGAGWDNWSWGTQDLANGSPVHSGTFSIRKLVNNYEGLYLHRWSSLSSAGYTNLSFWMHGGTTGGQHLDLKIQLDGASLLVTSLAPPVANTWTKYNVSLAPVSGANFNEIIFQAAQAGNEGNAYIDDLILEAGTSVPPASTPIVVEVDALRNRHPISALIYGVSFASSNELKELNATLNRSGGNASTRYNWQLNAANRGADWFFINTAESSATPGDSAGEFVRQSKIAGAEPMLTIPLIEWMPKTRQKVWSYSVAKYGAQTGTEFSGSGGQFWASADAGNGIPATNSSARITWNDPNDANYRTNSLFQQGWVQHLTNRWGQAANGGVRWYIMDNEPSLWHATHQDVHPSGVTMAEIRDKFFDYAEKVKAVDPGARIAGFEEWGWQGYFYSGYDQQRFPQTPDRAANGGMDYLPWLLQQAR